MSLKWRTKEKVALQILWLNEWKHAHTHGIKKKSPLQSLLCKKTHFGWKKMSVLSVPLKSPNCLPFYLSSLKLCCFPVVRFQPLLGSFTQTVSQSAAHCKLKAHSPINLSLFFNKMLFAICEHHSLCCCNISLQSDRGLRWHTGTISLACWVSSLGFKLWSRAPSSPVSTVAHDTHAHL